MGEIAIVTDSNSGITQDQADKLGVFVIPMPVIVDGEMYYEGIDMDRKYFYKELCQGINISTSQPSPADLTKLWTDLLESFDHIIHIPMSSSLSGGYQTAVLLSKEFDGKVHVVNNQRVSVSQRQSVLDALELISVGISPREIKEILEKDKFNSSIYIAVDTLEYLKKGGRITPAAASIGSMLKIKPVLQIQGDKLDSYGKARTRNNAKKSIIKAIKSDIANRFDGSDPDTEILLQIAHTNEEEAAKVLKQELQAIFPEYPIYLDHLPLNIACHLGPGALGVACIKKLKVKSLHSFML